MKYKYIISCNGSIEKLIQWCWEKVKFEVKQRQACNGIGGIKQNPFLWTKTSQLELALGLNSRYQICCIIDHSFFIFMAYSWLLLINFYLQFKSQNKMSSFFLITCRWCKRLSERKKLERSFHIIKLIANTFCRV